MRAEREQILTKFKLQVNLAKSLLRKRLYDEARNILIEARDTTALLERFDNAVPYAKQKVRERNAKWRQKHPHYSAERNAEWRRKLTEQEARIRGYNNGQMGKTVEGRTEKTSSSNR